MMLDGNSLQKQETETSEQTFDNKLKEHHNKYMKHTNRTLKK